MSEFIIRLKDKQDEIINSFLIGGYFNTKSEVIRAGLLELYNKYFYDVSKEEVELVKKATKYEISAIKKNKIKGIPLKVLEKKYGLV